MRSWQTADLLTDWMKKLHWQMFKHVWVTSCACRIITPVDAGPLDACLSMMWSFQLILPCEVGLMIDSRLLDDPQQHETFSLNIWTQPISVLSFLKQPSVTMQTVFLFSQDGSTESEYEPPYGQTPKEVPPKYQCSPSLHRCKLEWGGSDPAIRSVSVLSICFIQIQLKFGACDTP